MTALKQEPKYPVWLVRLQIPVAHRGTTVLGADGQPMGFGPTYGDESEITVHAKDEAAAKAYVEQHNPGAKVLSAVKE